MHHGDIQFLFQSPLYLEALRGLDVLQVDTAEGGGDGLDRLDELIGIFFIHLDIEDINTAIDFKEQTFTLHHWFTGHSAYVA